MPQKSKSTEDLQKGSKGFYQQKKIDKFLNEVSFVSYEDGYTKSEVKPGLSFYKVFLANAKRNRPFKFKMNIPVSTGLFSEKYMIYTSKKDGFLRIKLEGEVKEHEYYKRLMKSHEKQINLIKDKGFYKDSIENNFPVMLLKRVQDNFQRDFVLMINQTDVTAAIMQSQLYNCSGQDFIIANGVKASLYRYHHFNPIYSQSNKQNYALFITNNSPMDISKDLSSSRLCLEGYPQKSQIYKIHNMNTFTFHEVAEQLILFIQKHYGITIQEIVLDFIKDLEGTEWFIGCKAFKIVERQSDKIVNSDKIANSFIYSLLYSSRNNTEVRKAVLQAKKDELMEKTTTSQCCKLCKIKFRREQLRRIVTDSMLFNFVSHQRKRGVFAFEQTNISSNKSTESTSLVCDLCYMLIVAENELISIETQFAEKLSIPVNKYDILDDKQLGIDMSKSQIQSKKESQMSHYAFSQTKTIKINDLPQKPLQWRILIFLKEFLDMDMAKLVKHAKRDVYLQFRMYDYTTKFLIFSKKNYSNPSKELGLTRVHYFFTLPDESIKDFINNTEIEFRITDGPQFSKYEPLAVGKIFALRNFKDLTFGNTVTVNPNSGKQSPLRKSLSAINKAFNQQDQFEFYSTKIEYFNVAMFSKFIEETDLKVVIGLKRDYITRTEDLELKLKMGVYFPQDEFYNCDPLPETWIELFLNKQELDEYKNETYNDDYESKILKKNADEMPQLPVSQLLQYERKMELCKEKSRLKYQHIESRLHNETSTFYEKKRNKFDSFGERLCTATQAGRQTEMHTERSHMSKSQVKHTPESQTVLFTERSRLQDNWEQMQNSNTFLQTQSNINFTSRGDLHETQRPLKMLMIKKKRDENKSLTKQKKTTKQTKQNSLNSSQDTVNTKLLKKINSTMDFHHKKTQSIVPYLMPTYQKALKKMLKDYKQQMKESDIKSTRDTQMSINNDIKKTIDDAVTAKKQDKLLNIQIKKRKKLVAKSMNRNHSARYFIQTMANTNINNRDLL